jgi:UDP-glucose 6-dehydrogenase
MNSARERYVIIGFGWVGQATALALHSMGYEVNYFDPIEPPRHYARYADLYGSVRRLEGPLSADSEHTWYIVCVADRVSPEGVQDISSIKKALDALEGSLGGVILRSTVLPDLLKDLRFDYYVPEFMHEKRAVEECLEPYFFVIGSSQTRAEPSVFMPWRAAARKVFEGTPREAAFIKYLSNIWNALRIAFVNEFGDAVREPASKEAITDTAKIIDFIFDGHGYLRYGRAFGGHCLPKDSRAFARWRADKGQPVPLIEGMSKSNARHEVLEKKFTMLPEWFSDWEEWHISGWQALSELWHSVKKHIARPSLLFKRIR